HAPRDRQGGGRAVRPPRARDERGGPVDRRRGAASGRAGALGGYRRRPRSVRRGAVRALRRRASGRSAHRAARGAGRRGGARAQGGRTLWIGTDGGGVARLRHDGWAAFTSRNAPLDTAGYVEAVGESAAPDGSPSIWFAPNAGLLRWTGDAWAAVDVASVGWSA